jgi:hypothetical protein
MVEYVSGQALAAMPSDHNEVGLVRRGGASHHFGGVARINIDFRGQPCFSPQLFDAFGFPDRLDTQRIRARRIPRRYPRRRE